MLDVCACACGCVRFLLFTVHGRQEEIEQGRLAALLENFANSLMDVSTSMVVDDVEVPT